MILAVLMVVQIVFYACLVCLVLLVVDVGWQQSERALRAARRELERQSHARSLFAGHLFPHGGRHV